eukprot:augustus_masked-scaffold_1-processed-gene-7.40-mRNA-1 protein AED:1.00 eAED:1.00 QI:0/-1/0/0/-1/1/1/0/602
MEENQPKLPNLVVQPHDFILSSPQGESATFDHVFGEESMSLDLNFGVPLDPGDQQTSSAHGQLRSGSDNVNKENWSSKFVSSEKWNDQYQRANRNSGMKNIRCFPFCGPKHTKHNFCGESILIELETKKVLSSEDLVVFAEITEYINLSFEKGTLQSIQAIEDDFRVESDPVKKYWKGDLREEKDISKENGCKKKFCFEFNRERRGWHYGWKANRYTGEAKHVFRVFIFEKVSSDVCRCVFHVDSPLFQVYSRKPKRKNPLDTLHDKASKKAGLTMSSIYSVLGFIQKLLELNETEIEEIMLRKEEKNVLNQFARYILSDEENLTDEIRSLQSELNMLNVFEKSVSQDEVYKLAEDRFKAFIQTFNERASVDFNELLAHIPKSSEHAYLQLVDVKKILRELKKPFRPPNVILAPKVLQMFLSSLRGAWIADTVTLNMFESLYMAMELPVALWKCYRAIWNKMEFCYDPERYNELLVSYCPKLFAYQGTQVYYLDAKMYPWALGSPLANTKYDAIAIKSYVKRLKIDDSILELHVEHLFRNYKLARIFRPVGVTPSVEKLTGDVILYEKSVELEGCIQWTQIRNGEINFTRRDVLESLGAHVS